MERFEELLAAINSGDNGPLKGYWANHYTDDIKADLRRLVAQVQGEPIPEDLKEFTKAAMKGLCSAVCHGVECRELTTADISAISGGAIEIAKYTLSELSKHQ